MALLAHWQRWRHLHDRFRKLQWPSEEWEALEMLAGKERYAEFRKVWPYAANMDYLLEQAYRLSLNLHGKPGK